MRWIWRILPAALPLLCLPSLGYAWGCGGCGSGCGQPVTCTGSFSWNFNLSCHKCSCLAGPWYSYWPYDSYFTTPAPVNNYPYWPGTPTVAEATAVPGVPTPAAPVTPVPPTGAPAPAPDGGGPVFNQPAAYWFQTPSYWYQR